MFGKTVIYAHRGASGSAPENTMAAFELAVQMGSQGIECDVQRTKDDQLVLCHDEQLDRTTDGKGFIKDRIYEEIRGLDAGKWFGKQFKGERVPLLSQLLELANRSNIILNIELKNSIVLYEGMEDQVVDMVKSFGLQDRVILSSFNHYSIHEVKSKYPHIAAGALYVDGLYKPWNYLKELGCECAHPYYLSLHKEIVQGLTQNGFTINTYTVDDVDKAAALVKLGVEGIITNHPERMIGKLGLEL